jgi:hypothetical protein
MINHPQIEVGWIIAQSSLLNGMSLRTCSFLNQIPPQAKTAR